MGNEIEKMIKNKIIFDMHGLERQVYDEDFYKDISRDFGVKINSIDELIKDFISDSFNTIKTIREKDPYWGTIEYCFILTSPYKGEVVFQKEAGYTSKEKILPYSKKLVLDFLNNLQEAWKKYCKTKSEV